MQKINELVEELKTINEILKIFNHNHIIHYEI